VQILPGAVGIIVVGLPDKAWREAASVAPEPCGGRFGAIGLGLPPKRWV